MELFDVPLKMELNELNEQMKSLESFFHTNQDFLNNSMREIVSISKLIEDIVVSLNKYEYRLNNADIIEQS
ncbi:MAG: hypothetical protein ACLFMO_07120 [Eubacteriales bacterium]